MKRKFEDKAAFGTMLTLLLMGTLASAFNAQLVGAESSQPPATQWSKTYGGSSLDWAYALVQTGDGGYALVGITESFGAGNRDAWLVKTDAAGNAEWNKTYGGTSDDQLVALVQTGDGGYALAGGTYSFGAGDADAWLVKTDALGNVQWNKTYGGTNYEGFRGIVQTGDGGYALAGQTQSFGAGIDDFWLVKTDSSGNAQWNKTYGGTGEEDAYALVQTVDGGYALAGFTNSFGAGDYDIWLVKTDASGIAQWNKTYGGTSLDSAGALVQTVDGGYALAGSSRSSGAGGLDSWLVKTDAAGTAQWNRTYGGTSSEGAGALVQTVDGGYALAGSSGSFGAGGDDFWLVKTDAAGNAQWNKTSGGTSSEGAYALVQTVDEGYALAGQTQSFGAGYYDFWLIKVAAEHELVASIEVPTALWLGSSTSLNATVTNQGSSNESYVELVLLINGTTVDSATIPLLQTGNSHTLSYLWTPTVVGTYNITAYVHPVPGEVSIENNQKIKILTVVASPPPGAKVGVKAGDWIKIDYTISGAPSGSPLAQWLKVEVLSVEGTSATVRVTMHMSDGTEQDATVSVDVVAGGQAFGLSGFVIPANLTVGDHITMGGAGFSFNVTIGGESTRNYAGASRTVVYASFSQLGSQLTYYWDKQTGVMVEASTTSGSITATGKATETNMWDADSSPFWMQWWFYAIVAVVIVALAGAVYFLKKRKPPTPTAPSLPTEGTA